VINLIDGDPCSWEEKPLKTLAETGELSAYRHHGFWQPMDTLRDKTLLEALWQQGKAPWKVWS
jgi:glucose-1-phosphate cytidylyltransferase